MFGSSFDPVDYGLLPGDYITFWEQCKEAAVFAVCVHVFAAMKLKGWITTIGEDPVSFFLDKSCLMLHT